MPLVSVLWLQAQGPSAVESFLVPILLMIVPLYFLLIRPEQKRRKEHESLLKSLEKGDRVVTAGGIRGTVVGVTDDVLTLEIGKGGSVKVEVERGRVERKIVPTPQKEAK